MDKISIKELENKKYEEVKDLLEIKKYCPVVFKKNMVDTLVDKYILENEDGIYEIDHFTRNIMKCLSLVSLYTNIDIIDNSYYDYDVLFNGDIYENILIEIGNDALFYLNMLDGEIENKLSLNSIERVFAKKMDKIVDVALMSGDHLNDLLDRIDINKMGDVVSTISTELIKKVPNMNAIEWYQEWKQLGKLVKNNGKTENK